jgi:tripartite-type tricarboxylate transporter receptor subunit TctC
MTAQSHIKSGKLKALGISSLQRSPLVPDVPTIAESGLPGYDASSWFGMHAPAGTPRDISVKSHGVVAKSLQVPEMIERLSSQGAEAVGNTPEEFTEFLRVEIAKWAKVVKASGSRVD